MYKIIILPVVLCGCGIWSLALREEYSLRIFESMVLRKLFGPRRDEVRGGWKEQHNEDNLYTSPSIIRKVKSRKMKWDVYVE
jgi:hypothetical protein